MTNQNNAAQTSIQPTVLTREQVGELYKDWICIFGMSPGSAELCIREIEAAVLSKLRAPVADERAVPLSQYDYQTVFDAIGNAVKVRGNSATEISVEAFRAALASAPVAGEAQPSIMRFNPFAGLGMNPAPNGMYVRYEDHAAMLSRDAAPQPGPVAGQTQPSDAEIMTIVREQCPGFDDAHEGPDQDDMIRTARALLSRYAAPQASEAVRILFPAHLRKMWSGGEVQAWLDEHQGVTAPKASAKGSLERYRKWQADRDEAYGAGIKAAADLVKKMVDAYDTDHGSTDPETGTREYAGEGAAWVCEMQELEESIRALAVQPAITQSSGNSGELSAQPTGNSGELSAQPDAQKKGGSDAD
ncbi:hypothetical protein [Achromobacter aegrifaciens]|uniref:hypothetical protein n=1 Tax=Achromobacter aegrifaciens TaxID=1287736 RepID=UPI0028AD56DA|nr:hypothetical protein [Achromobacter aegrifaciens]